MSSGMVSAPPPSVVQICWSVSTNMTGSVALDNARRSMVGPMKCEVCVSSNPPPFCSCTGGTRRAHTHRRREAARRGGGIRLHFNKVEGSRKHTLHIFMGPTMDRRGFSAATDLVMFVDTLQQVCTTEDGGALAATPSNTSGCCCCCPTEKVRLQFRFYGDLYTMCYSGFRPHPISSTGLIIRLRTVLIFLSGDQDLPAVRSGGPHIRLCRPVVTGLQDPGYYVCVEIKLLGG